MKPKIWIGILTGLLLLFLIPPVKGKEFSANILQEPLPGKALELDIPLLESISKQPFSYLNQGREAAAFVSTDGNYVLKVFFKKRVYDPRLPLTLLHWLNIPKKIKNWARFGNVKFITRKNTLKTYEAGFAHLQSEAGLVAVSVRPPKEPLPTYTVTDRNGNKHQIDLNQTAFVLQKKARLLSEGIHPNEIDRIKEQLQTLLTTFYEKGFRKNVDEFKPCNYAFLEDHVVIIDLGDIKYRPGRPKHYQQKPKAVLESYTKWANSTLSAKKEP